MKFDLLCTVISLLHCMGVHVLALYYYLFFSYLVSECYVQRNDVLCRLKCITGGWGNTTYVTLSKLFTHEIIRAQTYSIYNQYTLHKARMTATLLCSRITWTIISLYSMKRWLVG